jgi:hypothetical protein
MPITSGNFAKALWPGVNAWYGESYDEYPVEWTDLFDTFSSRKAWEEDMGTSMFGLAAVKPEGSAVAMDTASQGFLTRYQHVEYGLGFTITRNMVEDDQYDVIGRQKASGLAFSMRQTKEQIAVATYNNAVAASPLGGDGVSLLNASHPNVSGGTYSNILSGTPNLSEAALEDICIQIAGATNDRGLKISLIAQSLHIPVDLMFEADRILNSTLRVATADNDLNSLKGMGKFPGGIKINHYFDGADDWFVRTNCKDGMKHFNRRPDDFSMDNDWDTDNAKYKATGRYSFGWTDPRALYGSKD